MAAVCVAVISKDNFPLYLRAVSTHIDNDLDFHHVAHTAIDVIEEKITAAGSGRGSSDVREHYLGPLYPMEEYKIYGYATNTRVKFIIITENTASISRDQEIAQLFKKLHHAYTDMFCNPFYTPNSEITSKKFDRTVTAIFKESESKLRDRATY